MATSSAFNPEAEKAISKFLQMKVPYQINIANATFNISNHQIYPPGELTKLFCEYLFENDLINNKTVVDVGAASFALGIVAAKKGATRVIGVDISAKAIECARENITLNHVGHIARVIQGNGLSPLLPEYAHMVDLLLCGIPWDTITLEDFNAIPSERKNISYAFYDIEDALISDVLSKGPMLCSTVGRIFITASMRVMERVNKLCLKHQMMNQIVKEKDIHQDGNIHYILEILPIHLKF